MNPCVSNEQEAEVTLERNGGSNKTRQSEKSFECCWNAATQNLVRPEVVTTRLLEPTCASTMARHALWDQRPGIIESCCTRFSDALFGLDLDSEKHLLQVQLLTLSCFTVSVCVFGPFSNSPEKRNKNCADVQPFKSVPLNAFHIVMYRNISWVDDKFG